MSRARDIPIFNLVGLTVPLSYRPDKIKQPSDSTDADSANSACALVAMQHDR